MLKAGAVVIVEFFLNIKKGGIDRNNERPKISGALPEKLNFKLSDFGSLPIRIFYFAVLFSLSRFYTFIKIRQIFIF